MRIGSIYPTFVYNTNYVSARSLGRVHKIPDDVLQSKTDYTDSSHNTNPLRPGTSRDFAGIFAFQMALGRMRAARVMRQPATEAGGQQPAKSERRQPGWENGFDVIDNMSVLEA